MVLHKALQKGILLKISKNLSSALTNVEFETGAKRRLHGLLGL